ncbi:MAG: hypothetical protein JO097_21080 [Acidobacteriaceae bacterium]|nr:hypothetical protein [Acidobacteriaceae bacterium]MBV9296824.1 hypothetical protein [Acidobacteriaceae bacterium]MBV9767176.1 hypothetical protein [Acidobacteriaceae bacterium]
MDDRVDLDRALSRLAESSPREASATAEERLVLEFRTRRRRRRVRWVYSGLAAACLALALAWSVFHHSSQSRFSRPEATGSYSNAMEGFVALPYAQSDVPLEEAVIVRVEVQTSELGMLGMPLAPAKTRGKVRADLLVGQDGVARAVRLVE